MSTERSGFYPKTVHVLFAVVLAISFQQASETMIPIQMVVEPEKIVPNIVLALSYLVVILGWVGYARSVSRWRYKDTRLGFLRFAIDILILFEYFYLLQVAHEHASHTAPVLLVLAITYYASELVKYYEQSRRQRPSIYRRNASTLILIITTGIGMGVTQPPILAMMMSGLGIDMLPPAAMVPGVEHLPGIVVCVGLAVWHRYAKWSVHGGSGTVRTVRGRPT